MIWLAFGNNSLLTRWLMEDILRKKPGGRMFYLDYLLSQSLQVWVDHVMGMLLMFSCRKQSHLNTRMCKSFLSTRTVFHSVNYHIRERATRSNFSAMRGFVIDSYLFLEDNLFIYSPSRWFLLSRTFSVNPRVICACQTLLSAVDKQSYR